MEREQVWLIATERRPRVRILETALDYVIMPAFPICAGHSSLHGTRTDD